MSTLRGFRRQAGKHNATTKGRELLKIDFTKQLTNLDGTLLEDQQRPRLLATENVKTLPPSEAEMYTELNEGVYQLKYDCRDFWTLGKVATKALIDIKSGDEAVSGVKKFERGRLAFKIARSNEGTLDVTVEEVADLKQLIARSFGPLVVVQAYEMLEG